MGYIYGQSECNGFKVWIISLRVGENFPQRAVVLEIECVRDRNEQSTWVSSSDILVWTRDVGEVVFISYEFNWGDWDWRKVKPLSTLQHISERNTFLLLFWEVHSMDFFGCCYRIFLGKHLREKESPLASGLSWWGRMTASEKVWQQEQKFGWSHWIWIQEAERDRNTIKSHIPLYSPGFWPWNSATDSGKDFLSQHNHDHSPQACSEVCLPRDF